MKPPTFLNLREALPRMAADFAVIHLSAVVSLFVSTYIHLHVHPESDARVLLDSFRLFYLTRFLPLSAIFPAIFSLSGLYTRSRGYALNFKYWTVLRAAALATLVYLFASFMLDPGELMPRSSILVFAALASLGLTGPRWLIGILRNQDRAGLSVPSGATAGREPPVLVVGGAGYIGSVLCHLLIERGRRVRVLDSLVYGGEAIADLRHHPNFEFQRGDCRNIEDSIRAMSGVSAVIHLAAIVGDPACDLDRRTALEVNYCSTRMLIEIAKGQGIARFLFASSCSVYGATDVLMDENSSVVPVSLYGRTKADSERALLDAATAGFHPVVLRLATVFGASYRPRFDLVVNLLTARAFAGRSISIFNGRQWRPFLHVRDAARGFIAVLDSPLGAVGGEVFNLGDNRLNFTLEDVAAEIGAAFPETRIERADNADARNYRVSFDKIRGRLGFECSLTLADGIRELKTALESGRIADYEDILYHNQRFLAGLDAGLRSPVQTEVMAAFQASAS
ncbi:MAG TPA: NAD-dependent epimerase/dehydratase family protein [Bryobacteraceae bacterium]|nr:NAD-dependent epimerase/dehydratase family protein [Bryobacteraceae bacterium]